MELGRFVMRNKGLLCTICWVIYFLETLMVLIVLAWGMVHFLHFFNKSAPTHAGSSTLPRMVWPFVIPEIGETIR